MGRQISDKVVFAEKAMKKSSFISVTLTAIAFASLCGCQGARWFQYVFQPRDETLVKPEYPIADKTVAVVIYTDQPTLYEYPNVRLSMGTKICSELENSLKNVKTISPFAVSRFQDDHVNWEAMDPRELGKDLKADIVLIVTLSEYRTREPGLMNTYQARMSAEAKLYDVSAKDTAPAWELEKNVEVVFPKDPRYEARQEPLIAEQAERMLADELVRKFYKHSYTTDDEGEKVFKKKNEDD